MKRIIFRVDSSYEIGLGHLNRCLNFAEYLKKKNYEIIFLCRKLEGNSNYLVRKKFKIIEIENKTVRYKKKWLHVDYDTEISDLRKVLAKFSKSILFIDHYGIDHIVEINVKHLVKKIVTISDVPGRKHVADILVDPNYKRKNDDYANFVGKGCKVYTGINFNFLSENFKKFREQSLKKRNNKLKNILIYFGGSDQTNLTYKILKKVIFFKNINFNIIINKNYRDYEKILALSKLYKNIKLFKRFVSMPKMMKNNDFMISSAGSLSWEKCYLGLPSIQFITANNQIKIAKELSKKGASLLIDLKDLGKLNKIIKNIHLNMIKMSFIARNIISEVGLENNYLILEDKNYYLKNFNLDTVEKKDFKYLFNLENKKNVRIYSKNPNKILISEHKKWFNAHLKNNNSLVYKITLNNVKQGIIRLDNLNNKIYISILIDPLFSRSGIAQQSLSFLLSQIYNHNITAEVHKDNRAAYNLFLNLGFIVISKKTIFHKFLLQNYRHKKIHKNGQKIINIQCDKNSWFLDYLPTLKKIILKKGYGFALNQIQNLDVNKEFYNQKNFFINFVISYSKIMSEQELSISKYNLIIHESDLPKGKGFSPMTWQILKNKNKIKISLFEATTEVDSGNILLSDTIVLKDDDLFFDWRKKQALATIKLCEKFLNSKKIKPIPQKGKETFYRRRKKEDSEINPNRSIISQFNLFRVVDNENYPAFFIHNNKKYILKIFKDD